MDIWKPSNMQSPVQERKTPFVVGVIDGQGGGIGCLIIEKLREELGNRCEIMALGTNAVAATNMLKRGANQSASGENAILTSVNRLKVIAGSVVIIAANGFSGELSPKMAEVIASCPAKKVLLPLNTSTINISGTHDDPLPVQAGQLAARVRVIYRQTR